MSQSTSRDILLVRDAVSRATDYFRQKGIGTARLDAELLVGEAVGMDRLHLYLNMDRPMDQLERERAREFLRRRALHEPVAYILGRKEFLSREFKVTSAVLIPRPETELLVEFAIQELKNTFPDEAPRNVLELGAGTGCVAISLALEVDNLRVTATETSADAVEVARENIARHKVEDRVTIYHQSGLGGLSSPFAAIISNPPYIPQSDRSEMPREVLEFEPSIALFAGADGLDVYKTLFQEGSALLAPQGFIMVEIGKGLGPAVTAVAEENQLKLANSWKDYAGIERVLMFSRRSSESQETT